MKIKIYVRSLNNYLTPPSNTHTSGGGLLDLPCTQGQLLMGAKLFSGTTQHQIFLFSPAWCPWQPIGHCSWVICKQTQDRHLHATHFFMEYFSLPLIKEKQAISYWRNKTVAK